MGQMGAGGQDNSRIKSKQTKETKEKVLLRKGCGLARSLPGSLLHTEGHREMAVLFPPISSFTFLTVYDMSPFMSPSLHLSPPFFLNFPSPLPFPLFPSMPLSSDSHTSSHISILHIMSSSSFPQCSLSPPIPSIFIFC